MPATTNTLSSASRSAMPSAYSSRRAVRRRYLPLPDRPSICPPRWNPRAPEGRLQLFEPAVGKSGLHRLGYGLLEIPIASRRNSRLP